MRKTKDKTPSIVPCFMNIFIIKSANERAKNKGNEQKSTKVNCDEVKCLSKRKLQSMFWAPSKQYVDRAASQRWDLFATLWEWETVNSTLVEVIFCRRFASEVEAKLPLETRDDDDGTW